MSNSNHNGNGSSNGLRLKTGLAEMLKGGVIMDVMDVDQAIIAEAAGAVAVMALERVPAMIRAEGGVARMSHPKHDQRPSKPPSPFPSWPRSASATSSRPRSSSISP